MPSFSALTVNIEGDNHLDKIQKLIALKQPDIVFVQELFATDLPLFQKALNVRGVYYPLCRIEKPNQFRLNPRGEWGLAILSRKPLTSFFVHPYQGVLNHIPEYISGIPNDMNRVALIAQVEIDSQQIFVGTTHFTWSDEGTVTDLQHQHMDKLLAVLDPYTPLLFCGDFNAPRGKAIFARLAEKYIDNIPPEVKTSIDPELHRKKNLQFMVDGMFTTPSIQAQYVEIIEGVSDHKAVFGIFSV